MEKIMMVEDFSNKEALKKDLSNIYVKKIEEAYPYAIGKADVKLFLSGKPELLNEIKNAVNADPSNFPKVGELVSGIKESAAPAPSSDGGSRAPNMFRAPNINKKRSASPRKGRQKSSPRKSTSKKRKKSRK